MVICESPKVMVVVVRDDEGLADTPQGHQQQQAPASKTSRSWVASVIGAEAGLFTAPPDAGQVAATVVHIAGNVLPPVVNAAAPGGHIHTINNFCSLLTENRFLLSHPGRSITVHLHKGLEVEGIEAPVVPVGLAGIAGDGGQLPHQHAPHHHHPHKQAAHCQTTCVFGHVKKTLL